MHGQKNIRVEVRTELEIDNGLGLLISHKAVLQDIRSLYSSLYRGKNKVLVIAQKCAHLHSQVT